MEGPFRDYGYFENKQGNKILCLNISKTYLGCKRPNIYDCTRKYWRLNGERAKAAEFVFAICCGYIIGVFKPKYWFLTNNEEYNGRWEFGGEEIKDSPYINMNVSRIIGKRQNPVMYLNM